MKKLLSLFAIFITLNAFSQAGTTSTFFYKAKFEGVTDAEKAQGVINSLKTVFKTNSTYNESTGEIEFSSTMSINQTGFNRLMSGEGYQMATFDKKEVKSDAPVTTQVTSEPAKKEPTTSVGSKNP